jgi:hypothetical protein
MNSIESRKQLLIVESELNRARLAADWRTITDEVHALADEAATIRSMASAVASLLAGVASLRRDRSAPAAEKPSWWRTIINGAGLASSFWSEFLSQSRERKTDRSARS